MRASSVVNRQFTRTASRLRLFCHASTLATQGLPVRYATLQALSSQHADLYLRHIQPTPVFGCVVHLQTLSYTPRLRRLERLVQRGQPVRVESLPCT